VGSRELAVPDSSLPRVRVSLWTQSGAKRKFDLVLALPLVIATMPLMLVIAFAIRISSSGPIFFRQQRCGRTGQKFDLWKFRTMQHHGNETGPALTRSGDPRITRVGRLLRKWKLDELPQLFNVLRGDMSLVGPRPDMPEYIAELPAGQLAILSLRPGITGWATLHFRHEEQLLATVSPEQLRNFYVQSLLPEKIRLDLEYGQRATMWSDFGILLKTLKAVFS